MVEKDFAGTRLAENFCVRWEGVIRCPVDATYTFYTESDDGSQLCINGRRVVDNSGSHALRERSRHRCGCCAGDHALRLEFIQEEGEAACRLSWAFEGREKEIIPADCPLPSRASDGAGESAALEPGLVAEFFELGGRVHAFPAGPTGDFEGPLARIAGDTSRPTELRVLAAAAAAPRLSMLEPTLYAFLAASLHEDQPPLVRMDAADALGKSQLDDAQTATLCDTVAAAGVLELPKLLPAFENCHEEPIGLALVDALGRSPGLKSLQAESLLAARVGLSRERFARRPTAC